MQKRSRFLLTIVLSFLLLAGMCIPALANRLYQVQPGDTVYQISHWYGITPEKLATANRLIESKYIMPQQVLVIPQPLTQADEKLYMVQPGDTLFDIALEFKTDLNWLQIQNKLTSDEIYTGQIVKVPAPSVKPQPVPNPSQTGNTKPKYVWNIPDLIASYPDKVFMQGTGRAKKVALTFDDGPDTEYTTKILDTLGRLGVKATFFLVGSWVKAFPELTQELFRNGHELGNHGLYHGHPLQMKRDELKRIISENERLIQSVTGEKTTNFFAPPYGEISPLVVSAAGELGYQTIMWSVDSVDWKNPAPEVLLNRVLTKIEPGGIVLLHPTAPTKTVLRELIRSLRKKGLEPGTVSQVLQ